MSPVSSFQLSQKQSLWSRHCLPRKDTMSRQNTLSSHPKWSEETVSRPLMLGCLGLALGVADSAGPEKVWYNQPRGSEDNIYSTSIFSFFGSESQVDQTSLKSLCSCRWPWTPDPPAFTMCLYTWLHLSIRGHLTHYQENLLHLTFRLFNFFFRKQRASLLI